MVMTMCEEYWRLFDIVCDLEDRQDAGKLVDEDEMSKAAAEFEKHKRECLECRRLNPRVYLDN